MEYNYDELVEKWRNGEELSEQEEDFLYKKCKERLIAGETISQTEFWIATDIVDDTWDYGETVEILSHGFITRELILTIDDKHYLTYVAWHDDYGIEDEEFVFYEVERKQVLTEKWVEVKKNDGV